MINKRKGIRYFLAGTLAFLFLSYGISYCVFLNLKKRVGGDVQGLFIPLIVGQHFKIHNASFKWQDKVRLVSGDLLIKYDLLNFIKNNKWHLQIESKNAVVCLTGDFAKNQGRTDLTLTDFRASFVFDKYKLVDINYLEAHSPTYHVSLK